MTVTPWVRVPRRFLALLPVLGVLLVAGCGTKVGHYPAIDQALNKEKYERAVGLLEEARENGTYEEKDRVLYSLELGIAQHYAALYEDSNQQLSKADQYIDDLFTKSISNMGFSFLTNSNQLPYRGEPHENIYLNVFKAFNYAQLDDPQAVFVEVRKLDEKLEQMETEFKRMAEDYEESALSSVDDVSLSGENAQFEAGESKFHSSALGRYLGYIMYLSQRDEDDARIDLNKMREAFQNQSSIYNFEFPGIPQEVSVSPGRARVNAFALLGRGPIKKEKTVRAQHRGVYVKWAFPVLKKRGTNIDRVVVERNGEVLANLDELEDINRVSEAIFNVKAPIIRAHNFVRALSKAIAAKEVRKNTDSGPLGMVASIASQEFTEKADLRTVRLLPGEVHVGHFTVPENTSVELTVRYYSGGEPIGSETVERTFERGEPNVLEIVNLN